MDPGRIVTEREIQPEIFPFEGEQEQRLDFMPLAARYRFDCCGVRPSLAQWRAMPLETRREVVDFDFADSGQAEDFRRFLGHAIEQASGESLACFTVNHPLPWDAPAPPAQLVAALATHAGVSSKAVFPDWMQLPRFNRYVLCKLSEPAKAHRLHAAFDWLTGAGSSVVSSDLSEAVADPFPDLPNRSEAP